MGLRGVGAIPLSKRQRILEYTEAERINPWEAEGLSRSDRVIAFCEDLTVTSGKEAFTKLKIRSWQRKFIERIYGVDKWGQRPVRTAVLSMGRKNGKSQLAAALALCHLCGPEAESRGEVYSCANDRFQASRIFNEMVALITNHPWLSLRTNIGRFKKEIEDLVNGSLYVALSAEAKTKMGLSPSFIVYDELGQASSRALYDAMDSALGARKEPLLLVISTQAADDFAPMSQLIDYGEKVNRGEIRDPAFHLTLYAATIDADPWIKATWKKANPALDDFRSLEDVKRLAAQAQRMPINENSFRNLILNQRVAAEARFLEPALWKENGAPPQIPDGAQVYAGLDLGSTRDLSALVLVYADSDGVFHVKPYCWLPGDPIARGDQDGAPYAAWIKSGDLISVGEATDPQIIAMKIAEVNGQHKIAGLAFDRWRVAEIKRELDAIGCNVPMIEHGQGYKDMSPAINVLHKLVLEHKLRHGNHPVLAMCAAHAVITTDPANNRKLDKSKSSGRIDALVALAMAVNAATLRAPKPIDIEALIG
jgi:phage terminase large subunit-like protein